jgi:transcriptional regulator with PAS, ATPase and Fis domain
MIDDEERIVFMCSKLIKMIGYEELSQIEGMRLRDVISTNKAYRVLETGERQIGVTYLVKGYTIVSNSYPIYRDGKLIGALEYDVFEDADLLKTFLDQMSSTKGLKHFSGALAKRTREKYTLESIKGSSSAVRRVKNEILQSSRSASNVMIQGETGTGKELIAQSIHMAGSRSIFEFVTVNCASIPSELFESELFGYAEGSFTGAAKGGKKGLIEIADKGTLFLDEMETLPLQMQAKLLRFLEEREIRAVGGQRSVNVDVRVICATNVNLEEMVRERSFRDDLYYRLNVINITAVALRERKSDIPELVNYFIEELNPVIGRHQLTDKITGIDNEALKLLLEYDWPGNVRELKNIVERAMNRCEGTVLTSGDFPDLCADARMTALESAHPAHMSAAALSLREQRKLIEREAIDNLITVRGLSVKDAAEELGISRQMLYRKLREYGLR